MFTKTFVKQFEQITAEYQIAAAPGGAYKPSQLSQETGEIAGLATGIGLQILGISITPALMSKAGKHTSALIYERIKGPNYRTKAKTLTETMRPITDRRKILSEAAGEVFQNFQYQFTKVTDKDDNEYRAIEKLAIDAAKRAIKYVSKQKLKVQFTTDLVTQGVILGRLVKDVIDKVQQMTVSGPAHSVKFDGKMVSTSVLFENVGLVCMNEEMTEKHWYYKKIYGKPRAEYGYRHMFQWELKTTSFKNEYAEVKEPKNAHEYNLKAKCESMEQIVREIYKKEDTLKRVDYTVNTIKTTVENIFDVLQNQSKLQKDPVRFNMTEPVKSFTGRTEELQIIHEALQSANELVVVTQVATISGLGGIGKSELARQYAFQHSKHYNYNLIWINSETPEEIRECFKKLAKCLKINVEESVFGKIQERNIEFIVSDVYSWFINKSIFIFDNVEDYSHINEFLPKSLSPQHVKPKVLITTRIQMWDAGDEGEFKVISLSEFSPLEAVEYVKKRLGEKFVDMDEDMIDLAELLQYFPLALKQATAYIYLEYKKLAKRYFNKSYSIRDYLDLYKDKTKELLDFQPKQDTPSRYNKTILTTWNVTLETIKNIENIGDLALKIIRFLAYLSPDKVDALVFFKTMEGEEKMWDAIELLQKYSMINLTKGIVSIHRLVQEALRYKVRMEDKEEEVIENILKLVNWTDISKEDKTHATTLWSYVGLYPKLVENFYFTYTYGHNKNTPLHLMAGAGNLSIVKLLIENGADINAKDSYGIWTPLYSAVAGNHLEIAKYLVDKGAEINIKNDLAQWTPIYGAAEEGNFEIVKFLVDKGVEINVPNSSSRWPPIYGAARAGHLAIVKYLVEKGAEINVTDDSKPWTPLYGAAEGGNLSIVKFLVENGADVNADSGKWPPLYGAAKWGHFGIVKFLVEKGADVNFIEESGRCSPLYAAAEGGDIDIVKFLVEKGAEINVKDDSIPCTPICAAAEEGNLEVVKFLVEKGAEFNFTNASRKFPPICMAAGSGNLDIVRFLVDKGADVNVLHWRENWTPLFTAASRGYFQIVKVLVENGADINKCSVISETAKRGYSEIVDYLLKNSV